MPRDPRGVVATMAFAFKGFKSIQTKYIVLVLSCVVGSALLIGGVSVRSARDNALRAAAQGMNLTCESYKYKYDASLKDIQGAVETAATFASSSMESLDRFSQDETYRNTYASQLEQMLAIEVLRTPSVMSYYVRFSPDLLSFERGFRFSRPAAGEDFQRVKIVKIEDYSENDAEHVGWYYEPISQGKTTWLEPYYNANFDTTVVSCVTPFYKDGKLAGVIGMDIDFSTFIADLADLRIYDNGYAFLCSSEGKVYYHPLYEPNTYIQQDVLGFDAELEKESSGEVLYGGVSKGEQVDYAFRTLTNDMRLVLRAPEREIGAEALAIARTISGLVLVVLGVSTLLTIWVCRRITKPLLDLTTAASMISAGDYNIKLDVTTQDEVGVLARTLQIAAVELRANAERMNQLAYKDSLTSVRNKTAYDLEVSVLQSEIDTQLARFGIAVFDINDLKGANDIYGHEQGDKVIKIGCNRICMAFPHSPVFRVGGDEFVAVITGEEIHHIDERLAAFAERTKVENAKATRPQDVVHVAVGVAFYDPAADKTVQDVFNRADAMMYESKQAMKMGRYEEEHN